MLHINFQKNFSAGGWSIYAQRFINEIRVPYKITIERLEPVKENLLFPEPSCVIGYMMADEVIKALLDGLAEAGLIPRMGATEAELVATKRHLADMRALAFETVQPEQKTP